MKSVIDEIFHSGDLQSSGVIQIDTEETNFYWLKLCDELQKRIPNYDTDTDILFYDLLTTITQTCSKASFRSGVRIGLSLMKEIEIPEVKTESMMESEWQHVRRFNKKDI